MSKIYLLAVNWEIVKSGKVYRGVSCYDTSEGCDIAGFTTYHPVSEWRIYGFTTKKARDALMNNIIKEGV